LKTILIWPAVARSSSGGGKPDLPWLARRVASSPGRPPAVFYDGMSANFKTLSALRGIPVQPPDLPKPSSRHFPSGIYWKCWTSSLAAMKTPTRPASEQPLCLSAGFPRAS